MEWLCQSFSFVCSKGELFWINASGLVTCQMLFQLPTLPTELNSVLEGLKGVNYCFVTALNFLNFVLKT